MHIPDGMLDTKTWVTTTVASGGVLTYAVTWVKRTLSDRRTVLMAVMAALVFALQMLNFPIAPGISGHFAGGAASAILLGPWPAVIVLTTVLIVQALLFADGGITALGANVLNLAVIGPLVGYAVWRLTARFGSSRRAVTWRAATAAFVAVECSAFAVAVEVWASGRAPLGAALAALLGWHALVGAGEAAITAGLVAYVATVRPDLVSGVESGPGEPAGGRAVAVVLGAVAAIAAGLSFLASSNPDALEFVAAGKGFESSAAPLSAPLADYSVPGIPNETLAGVLAGLVGAAIVGALLWAAVTALRSRRATRHDLELHRHGHEHEREPAHEHPHHHVDAAHDHAHALSFERYTYVLSPVHSLDPRAKIVATAVFILGVVLAPAMRPVEFAALLVALGALTVLSRIPVSVVLKRSALVLPLAATFAIFAPLMPGGWVLAWSIVSKAYLSAFATLLLAATTPTPRLFAGLRKLGLPVIFVSTLTFLARFTDVLRDQLASMRRAVASRAPGLTGWPLVRLYGNLAGNLFIRSYERGERVHSAMLSRGYTGVLPSSEPLVMRPADVLVVLCSVLVGAALFLY